MENINYYRFFKGSSAL